jgi:hypothetical protein
MISTFSPQFPRRKRLSKVQGNEAIGVSELALSSVIRPATNHRVSSRPSCVDEMLTLGLLDR